MNDFSYLHTRILDICYKYQKKHNQVPTCLFLGPKEKRDLEDTIGNIRCMGLVTTVYGENDKYMNMDIYYMSKNGIRCGVTIGE